MQQSLAYIKLPMYVNDCCFSIKVRRTVWVIGVLSNNVRKSHLTNYVFLWKWQKLVLETTLDIMESQVWMT